VAQKLAHLAPVVRDYDAATGGRVFLFLHTDDFWREDLYGNRWDLVQPR
jgi:hypothetical protein